MQNRGEIGRRARTVGVISVLALAMATTLSATGAAAGKSPFKPGLYVGKTSQGEAVKLTVKACGKSSCLSSPTDEDAIKISLPCQSIGETSAEVLDLLGYPIAKNGEVSVDDEAFTTVTKATFAVGHNGTLTGRFRSVSTSEEGVKCDSGNVTLKAKIGGSTR